MRQFAISILLVLFLGACGEKSEQHDGDSAGSATSGQRSGDLGEPASMTPVGPTADPALREAFFGDLHVHTRYSYDAFVFGTRADPDAAYEFAKGNAIEHPAGFELKLDRPLDFQGVTDHGTYLGMLEAMTDPDSPVYEHPAAKKVREASTPTQRQGVFAALQPYVRFVEDADPAVRQHRDMDIIRSAWGEVVASANRHNNPGRFTTFIGYEYTSAGAGGIYNNLHRNVVFRGSRAPDAPFSRLESYNPEDLWQQMDEWRAAGMDAIAIPHNSNGSGGRMFEYTDFAGNPINDAYVEQRTRNEPIVEVSQTKGSSETHPALSPNDEWADFEIMPYRVSTRIPSEPPGSYVRNAFRRGLDIQTRGVKNPYKFGLIGSSDTHVAGGSFEEDNYWGPSGLMRDTAVLRGSVPLGDASDAAETVDDGSGRRYSATTAITNGAAGLAGVWAAENTRAALFDAMRRRETFATSGPRIRVRFFGGARIADLDVETPELVARAYASGVPMGGDLRGDEDGLVPAFLVWATRDSFGAPLQRLQVIKGWSDGSRTYEQVYDVACSDGLSVDPASHRCPDNGANVDLTSCDASQDLGDDELKVIWTDPDFDPEQRSFYYVRVLQNPTCRWSTWDALRAGVAPREDVAATLQERAWSAPIWYTPP